MCLTSLAGRHGNKARHAAWALSGTRSSLAKGSPRRVRPRVAALASAFRPRVLRQGCDSAQPTTEVQNSMVGTASSAARLRFCATDDRGAELDGWHREFCMRVVRVPSTARSRKSTSRCQSVGGGHEHPEHEGTDPRRRGDERRHPDSRSTAVELLRGASRRLSCERRRADRAGEHSCGLAVDRPASGHRRAGCCGDSWRQVGRRVDSDRG